MTLIRCMLAVLVLTRICTSLALTLLDGASSLLQAAALMIALIGVVPVALVIGGMIQRGHASSAVRRGLGARRPEQYTAR